jgi:hypothetical protein
VHGRERRRRRSLAYRHVLQQTIAFVNVLYALQVPRRNGQPLGATLFANMTAAYDALPGDVKRRIEGRTATRNFEKFWEMMRQRGGATTSRAPMTDEQKRQKPPVSHPIHLLATDTACVWRHRFEPATGEVKAFRSGYSNVPCPPEARASR